VRLVRSFSTRWPRIQRISKKVVSTAFVMKFFISSLFVSCNHCVIYTEYQNWICAHLTSKLSCQPVIDSNLTTHNWKLIKQQTTVNVTAACAHRGSTKPWWFLVQIRWCACLLSPDSILLVTVRQLNSHWVCSSDVTSTVPSSLYVSRFTVSPFAFNISSTFLLTNAHTHRM